MRDQIQLPKEHSTRNYVQMYIKMEDMPRPIIAVGKNPIQRHSQIIEEVLQDYDIAHPHITSNIPHIAGDGYMVISQGYCSLEGKTWTFNERIYRIGREDPRIDGHFDQMREIFPELEIKVKTIYEQMVNQ